MDSKILDHVCTTSGEKFSLFGTLSQIPTTVIDGIAHADIVNGMIDLKLYSRTGVRSDSGEITIPVVNIRLSPESFVQFSADTQTIINSLGIQESNTAKVNKSIEMKDETLTPPEEVGIRLG